MKKMLVVLILLIAFVNCARKDFENSVTESIRSFPSTLNPVYVTDEVGAGISDKIFSGLFCFDEKGEPIPDLVESYKIINNGKEILITLRKNVYWHDGAKFSSEDVLFTFNLLRNPDIAYPYYSDLSEIESIEKLGPYKVKIKYKKPFAPALVYLTFKILPFHILKDFLSRPKKFKTCNFSFAPIGTGPYKFSKMIEDQMIVLKAFPKYFKGKPEIKKYIAQFNPEALINPLKLIKGEVDIAEIEPPLAHSFLKNKEFKEKVNIFFYKKNSFTYLAFNLNLPLFKSKKIRKALTIGLNRKGIVKKILYNWGEVCSSPIILPSWKNNNLINYKYNPKLAKKMLKEAGWIDIDNDGVLEKNDREFSFTILTNSESLIRKNIALIAKQNWEDLGIKVKVVFLEYGVFLEKLRKRNFETAISGFLLDLDPNQYELWNFSSPLNYSGYKNEKIEELLLKGRTILNREKRKEIYNEFQSIIVKEMPVIFLISPYYIMGVNKRIDVSLYPKIIGSTNSFSSFILYWKIKKNKI